MQGSSKQFSVCLFNNWQQEYNERKKRNKLPLKTIDLLIPDHAPVGGCVCADVCLGLYSADWDGSVPHPPVRTAIHAVPLRTLFCWFNGLSFLASHSFQTLPQCLVLQSEKLPSIQHSLGNGKLHTVCDTHRDIWNITWTNELCVYVFVRSEYTVCVCTCVYTQ